jgi:tetratricopeptide (TPR) repeat protein
MELGSIYLKLDRPEEAIKAYYEALRIRPEYVEVYGSLALAYDHCGDFIKALGMYMRAISYFPGSVDLQRNLGLAFFNSGNYPEAIKAYGRAIQISPQDGRAYYYLGLVHLDLEDREAAMAMQAKLKELGANDLAAQLLDEVARQTWRLPPGSDRELELLAGDSRSR